MVQAYAGEEKNAWEDLRHGFILGNQNFIEKIKSGYPLEKPDKVTPQKHKVLRSSGLQALLRKAASLLESRVEDLVVYLFRNTGYYSNREIGDLFALTYSSVSKSATRIQPALCADRKMRARHKKINSLFKV